MNAELLLAHYERVADAPDAVARLRRFILDLAVRGKLVPQEPTDNTAFQNVAAPPVRGAEDPALNLRSRLKPAGAEWDWGDLERRSTPVDSGLIRERILAVTDGPFDLPDGWGWVTVGAVADARLGKMLDKSKNKGIPRRYLRNVNVRWFDFDLSDVLEMRFEDSELAEFELRSGDVLICEGGEPGRAAVWDEREEGIYFQKAIHRVRFHDLVDPHYFVKALRASADDGRLAEFFTGTGIKHFTGRGLDAYAFPLPPLADQHRIVAKVDELMALCDRLEAGLTEVGETRRRLLDALLAEAVAPGEAGGVEAVVLV
jgi:type I restriction enzyme S subunit